MKKRPADMKSTPLTLSPEIKALIAIGGIWHLCLFGSACRIRVVGAGISRNREFLREFPREFLRAFNFTRATRP